MMTVPASELRDLSLSDARSGLVARDFTAEELCRSYLDSIDRGGALNAWVSVLRDDALERARLSDKRLSMGAGGMIEGIPLGIKDLFCTKGFHSQACSHILSGFVPSYESTVTQKLLDSGGVFLGKLNMDEFAMGSSNETSYYGPVVSPWRRKGDDRALTPGGSSGGSSAAVSARMCCGALGTDTGGSIRQPAALTGIVGIKPTYGRVSRWGIIAFASSLDQAGVLTRTVRDSAILLGCISGYDEKDSTSIDVPVPDYEAVLGDGIRGLRVGIPREYRVDGMSSEIESLWRRGIDWLRSSGAEIIDVSLPHTHYALPAYYIIAPAEASSNLARYDGVRYGLREGGDEDLRSMYGMTRASGFGAEVRRRILIGTYVLSAGYYDAYYVRALKVRRLIADDFSSAFGEVDVLLTPSTPNSAFASGEVGDPLTMYLNDVFTVPVNMAGLPAISVPSGLDSSGLPLGLQLIGRPFDEETVFRVASVLESCADFTSFPSCWWEGD